MSGSGERRRRLRRLGRFIPLIAVALVLLVGVPPARAHATLQSADPPAGSVLPGAALVVALTFSQEVPEQFREAHLLDADGQEVAGVSLVDEVTQEQTMLVQLPALPQGAYGLSWQVMASDGHLSRGVVPYTVGAATGREFGTEQVPSPLPGVVAHWLALLSVATALGTVAVALVVIPQPADEPQSSPQEGRITTLTALERALARRRLLAVAVPAAAIAVLAMLLVLETERRAIPGSTLGSLLSSRWGHLWLVGTAAIAVLIPILLALRESAPDWPNRRSHGLQGTTACLFGAFAAAEALRSHLETGPQALVAVPVGALHVLAALTWIGCLPALLVLVWPRPPVAASGGSLLRRARGPFSRLAAWSLLVVAVTGILSAGRELWAVDDLVTTSYGRILLLKAGLLVVIGALAAYNSSRLHGVRTAWNRAAAASAGSHRGVLGELAAGVLVVLAAAMLAATAPHASAVDTPAGRDTSPLSAGAVDDLVASATLQPAHVGSNIVTVLVASSRRPPPADIQTVTLTATLADEQRSLVLSRIGDGRYFGTLAVAHPGELALRLEVARGAERLHIDLSPQPAIAPSSSTTAEPATLAGVATVLALLLLLVGATVAILLPRWARRRTFDEPLASDESSSTVTSGSLS